MKKIILLFFTILITLSCYSQIRSLNGGYSNMGNLTLSIKIGDQKEKTKYLLDDKVSLQYEKITPEFNQITEFSVSSYSPFYENNKEILQDSLSSEGIKIYNLSYYTGFSFFKGKRFQLPLLFGVGLSYAATQNFSDGLLGLGVGIKLQPLIYITGRIALYVEGSATAYAMGDNDSQQSIGIVATERNLQGGIKINF